MLNYFYNPNSGVWIKNQSYLDSSFYHEAFSGHLTSIWGSTQFGNEITDLCYHKSLQCMLRDNYIGEAQRRDLLYYFLKPMFNSDNAESTLNSMFRIMPSSNLYLKRALNNLCVIYDEIPTIQVEGRNEDIANELLRDSNLGMIMQKSYRLLKLHNEVLIRPFIALRNGKKKLEYQYTSPDKYRVKYDRLGNPEEVWIHFVDTSEEFTRQDKFYVWTKDTLQVKGIDNKNVPFTIMVKDKPLEVVEYKHGFGIIPMQIRNLAFMQDDELEIDGGGMFELLKAQIKCNMLDFYILQGTTFNSFPMRMLINWYLDNPGVISANGMFIKDDVRADSSGMTPLPPTYEEISADTTFENLEEFKLKTIKDVLKQFGLPPSLVDDTITTPSGAALREMRRELDEARIEDLNSLRPQDKELVELTLLIADRDPASPYRGQFGDTYQVSIEYADFQAYTEFAVAQQEADYLKANGLISPLGYLNRFTEIDEVISDEDAIEYINKNKELFSQLGGRDDTRRTDSGNANTELASGEGSQEPSNITSNNGVNISGVESPEGTNQ